MQVGLNKSKGINQINPQKANKNAAPQQPQKGNPAQALSKLNQGNKGALA